MHPPELQADACAAFERWASLQDGCPRNVGSLIERVERTDDHIGLMVTEVRGRRVVWKSAAFAGKARLTFPTIAIESVDAWDTDAVTLRRGSDHIAACGACAGAGRDTCAVCAGNGAVTCGTCGGQRKMYGYAVNGSRRLLNCQSCRGKGQVDCANCLRGIATCSTCAGSGRVQRWIELEWWQRSVANAQPDWIAQQFGWNANVPNEVVARDAELVVDIQRPHRVGATDAAGVPSQWLTQLAPTLQAGERITDQRLRIARIPTYTVHYWLGTDIDRVPFLGRRLIAPQANEENAFSRRASRLRPLRWLLLLILFVLALISFGRGAFYRSVPTTLSLVASAGALAAIFGAVAEWTAARRRVHHWFLAAVACALVAIALTLAALPRRSHMERLVAAGELHAAENELNALGDAVDAGAWADLRLARIRLANDVAAAREELARIPRNVPQYASAANVTGRLLLRDIASFARARRWKDAADAIIAARSLGVAETELAPFSEEMQTAAVDAATAAAKGDDAAARLQERIAAEAIFVQAERAAGSWGTPPLIALRSAMASDVAAIEKAARRRAS